MSTPAVVAAATHNPYVRSPAGPPPVQLTPATFQEMVDAVNHLYEQMDVINNGRSRQRPLWSADPDTPAYRSLESAKFEPKRELSPAVQHQRQGVSSSASIGAYGQTPQYGPASDDVRRSTYAPLTNESVNNNQSRMGGAYDQHGAGGGNGNSGNRNNNYDYYGDGDGRDADTLSSFGGSSTSSSSSSGIRPPSIRVREPTPFNGRTGNDMALENFIISMERYLRVTKIDTASLESCDIASVYLTEIASQWFEQFRRRDPTKVRTWNELVKQLRIRFQSTALKEVAFARLTQVRYTKNINQLNDDFLQQLQFLPEYNSEDFDKIMVQWYMTALDTANTRFIVTQLRIAIQEGKIISLQDAMQRAILFEANMRSLTNSSNSARGVMASSSSSSMTPSSYGRRPSSSSSSSSGNWRSGGGRSFMRSPTQFRTPVKPSASLHHLDAYESDNGQADDEINTIDEEGASLERELDGHQEQHGSDAAAAEPTFHADDGGADPFAAAGVSDEHVLNMMRFTKKFGDLYQLSADDLDRCRRMNTCFNCKQSGHYARECKTKPKPNSSFAGGGAGAGGARGGPTGPSKRHF
jgi:Ty3 transposon capsid-like protein/Zinc knuckle